MYGVILVPTGQRSQNVLSILLMIHDMALIG